MRKTEALKYLTGSMAIYYVMAACSASGGGSPGFGGSGTSSSGGKTSSSGAGSGGSSGSPVADANADPTQSGTRLKVQYYMGADGSQQTAGMFDSQLNVQCNFGVASDGKIRCLPVGSGNTVTAFTEGYFSDSGCSQPLGVTIGACSAAPTVVSVSATNNCTTTTTNYQAGAQFTGTLYQGSPSVCTAMAAAEQSGLVADGFKFYALGTQIQPPDPSQYVEATLQTAP